LTSISIEWTFAGVLETTWLVYGDTAEIASKKSGLLLCEYILYVVISVEGIRA